MKVTDGYANFTHLNLLIRDGKGRNMAYFVEINYSTWIAIFTQISNTINGMIYSNYHSAKFYSGNTPKATGLKSGVPTVIFSY